MASTITLRELQASDYHKGHLQLLSQLTTVGEVTEAEYIGRFAEMVASEDYKIFVAEDVGRGVLVGSATLAVERKFIHQCGKVGHIEDVVVDESCRGQKIGLRLIQALIEAGKAMGCYKVILDCAESNAPFYEKCGLTRKEVQMVKYLDR